MIVALLALLALPSAAEPEEWKALPPDEEGTQVYRRLEAGPDEARPRVVLRATPVEPREWTSGELTYEFDCQARTLTILGARALDADGAEMRSVTVPEDRRTAEPIYAGGGVDAIIYADVCAGGPALDEPPPAPPPIAIAPTR